MTNVLRDSYHPHGHLEGQNNEFVVDGNLRAAYEALKEMFNPVPKSKSGPIKPLTLEEVKMESADARAIADTIENL